MTEGLPFASSMTDFTGGSLAQGYAQARAALARKLGGYGSNGLPSGFATSANNQLNSQQARDYDNSVVQNQLLNFQTKQQGAEALNPQPFFSGAAQGYGSVASMPVQPSPIPGIVGGAAAGLLKFV